MEQRIASILATTTADSYTLYLTEGKTFRYDLAKTKPYKGTRIDKKPWHFDNLTAYMKGALPYAITPGLEADDAMAMASDGRSTIVCSRDKDLKQVPGLFYSWELGKQPSFGPTNIDAIGTLALSDDRKSLKGTGYAFFCGQLLVGDRVDNIPGAAGIGPVKAYELLAPALDEAPGYEHYLENLFLVVEKVYQEIYGKEYETILLEQGQLLWIVRRLTDDGKPELWQKGLFK